MNPGVMKYENIIVAITIYLLIGCNPEKNQHDLSIATQFEITEANSLKTYIELERLSIGENNYLVFSGNIMDPFGGEKLRISISGITTEEDDGEFILYGKDDDIVEKFIYKYIKHISV